MKCLTLPLLCLFAVNVGDRVAQLVLERIVTPEVEEVEELDDT
jgi:dUTP pyrophosphatase